MAGAAGRLGKSGLDLGVVEGLPAELGKVCLQFGAADVTQIDDYTKRVKRMVGKVLTGNGIPRCEQCRQRLDVFICMDGSIFAAETTLHPIDHNGTSTC